MQDGVAIVRSHFISRVHKGLSRMRLPVEFIALYAFTGLVRNNDKEEEKSCVSSTGHLADSEQAFEVKLTVCSSDVGISTKRRSPRKVAVLAYF